MKSFDILTALEGFLKSKGVDVPMYFNYRNTDTDCFYILNTNNNEKEGASGFVYQKTSEIVIVSRFLEMDKSQNNIKQIHELILNIDTPGISDGILTDSNNNKAVCNFVELISAPRFLAVNDNQNSKEYTSQYNLKYNLI